MKDYVINSPLINEWNWEKNNELGFYPDKITLGSGKKVWWICDSRHEYLMSVCNKSSKNYRCPYCVGKKVVIGFNDLATVNQTLASEWDYDKNGELTPDMVTGVCGKSVWWKCSNEHEWKAKISNRANGNKCPYCSGYYILSGYNDLATTRPDLAEEWDYEKNWGLLPTQVSRGYGDKVWWKCKKCGHEWKASPNSRDNMNSGCPECSKGNRTSSQEFKLYYYIKKYFSDAIHGYSDKQNGITELDIYIPSLHIGIEYDGTRWHTNTNRDKNKDDICNKNNIKLIRIREPKCPKYDSNCIFIYLKNRSQRELENVCKNILNFIGVDVPDINFDVDLCEINNLIIYQNESNSLAVLYPNIAREWHPIKNGNLTPYNVSIKSDKRVWWICNDCGLEYVTQVKNRTKGCGCPNCGAERARRAHCKAVYCPQLDQSFESMIDAENKTGINYKNISACINGNREFAGKHPVTGENLTWIKL